MWKISLCSQVQKIHSKTFLISFENCEAADVF